MAAAVESFRRHSVAGTSLQMISDELGLTKSAIYHHFRTRDELLEAILEPVMGHLEQRVAVAETARGPRARADAMLTGFVALAVAHRDLIPVLTGDGRGGPTSCADAVLEAMRAEHDVVLCDRYVASNAAYSAARLGQRHDLRQR